MKSGMTYTRDTEAGTQNLPQWSPLMKSGMTSSRIRNVVKAALPQWSPLMKSGMTPCPHCGTAPGRPWPQWSPLMKSGMTLFLTLPRSGHPRPQWSPLMKSGMTPGDARGARLLDSAAMEPAHEERDDEAYRLVSNPPRDAAMEPAHEERDDLVTDSPDRIRSSSRNGARS